MAEKIEEVYTNSYFRHPVHEEIAQARYYLKDGEGNILEKDIHQVFARVVKHLTGIDPLEKKPETNSTASADLYSSEMYDHMINKRLMPGGRILAQAGTRVQNLNNCYVLPSGDSREEIMQLQRNHFMIQSQGGGTGNDASVWRPRWSWVKGNQSRSCGAIGFISLLSAQSSIVAQGGNRSGANLAMLKDWHPDMLDFIEWKSSHNWSSQIASFANVFDESAYQQFEWNNPYQWQMFNVSVGISDKFMKSLNDNPDEEWQFDWQGTPWTVWKYKSNGKIYEVTAPDENLAESKILSQFPFFNKSPDFELVKANYNLTVNQLWHRIAKNAHEDGCPGVLFIDRIKAYHNGEYYAPIVSTNPCGEQPLPANGVCCLGAVNLYYCMNNLGELDENVYKNAIRSGIRMLNYVTDVTKTGIEEVDKNTLNERRIGLGVTGIADALIKAKLKYSSKAGREFVKRAMEILRDTSYDESIHMAMVKGAFPAFNYDGYSKSLFFKSLPKEIREKIKKYGIRNVTCNTIAPYGTTGTIMGTSTGCEPHFAMEYNRNSRVGSYKDGCFDYIDFVAKYPDKKIPDYFESSHEISFEDHIRMLDTIAEFIDSSVSKTINLPANATIADIKKAYEFAYSLGHIKSLTVYRDGSKQQILETLDGSSTSRHFTRPNKVIRHDAPKRPTDLPCDIHRTTVKGTPWVVMVGMLDNQPYEVFAGKQKLVEIDDKIISGVIIKQASNKYMLQTNGTRMNIREVFENAEQAALTRQISMNLRHGTDIAYIVDQLEKSEDSIVDFSKAIARVLKRYVKESQKNKISRKCTSCGSKDVHIVTQSGCDTIMCNSCGQSSSKCD